MASFADTLFAAVVSAHPAMIDPKDRPPITIPDHLLPSMHEDKDIGMAFMDAIKVEKYVETFDDMPHVGYSLSHDPYRRGVALICEQGYMAACYVF